MRTSRLAAAVVIGLACLATAVAIRRRPATASTSEPVVSARRAPPRDLDLTFLVTADTHVGYRDLVIGGPAGMTVDAARDLEIRALNEIAGKPLPSALGGTVGEPRGLLIAGDLTEQGRPHEWAQFEAIFGLTGKEGRIRYPVYEGAGNHDKWAGNHVEKQIARRHGAARYSWDWGDVHLVCLGEAPNGADLEWLRADLTAAGPLHGIILFLHFPLEGPNSTGQWFGDGDYRARLADVLAGREVLGIFNGHSHTSGHYRWRGWDAYLEGSVKHAWHSFAVVHITGERMTVASYNYDRRGFWWWHDKPIFGATGPVRQWFAGDATLVGKPEG
jgi:cytolysin (calcineurin-like family phosphatase)